jgi:hypothetical protein
LAGEQRGAGGRVAEDAQYGTEAVAEEKGGGLRAAGDLQFAEQAAAYLSISLAICAVCSSQK